MCFDNTNIVFYFLRYTFLYKLIFQILDAVLSIVARIYGKRNINIVEMPSALNSKYYSKFTV